MTDWKAICRVDDIPRLSARRVNRPGGVAVAVFRAADDRVYALLDRCPHKGGPLSQDIVFGDAVACPLHNWAIALADAQARAPDEGCTPSFACKGRGRQCLARRQRTGHRRRSSRPWPSAKSPRRNG